MQLIAVTDIFGKTADLEDLLGEISSSYASIETVDPYGGEQIDFENEQAAYDHFNKRVGLSQYIRKLANTVAQKAYDQLTLLGFSVGATAIWAMALQEKELCNTTGVCFYSSQIRNYLDGDPNICIDMYFAKSEPSYDVDEVMRELSHKSCVRCHKTDYHHGFMNRRSAHFNQHGYDKFIQVLRSS